VLSEGRDRKFKLEVELYIRINYGWKVRNRENLGKRKQRL
jgi:hypothetical protein